MKRHNVMLLTRKLHSGLSEQLIIATQEICPGESLHPVHPVNLCTLISDCLRVRPVKGLTFGDSSSVRGSSGSTCSEGQRRNVKATLVGHSYRPLSVRKMVDGSIAVNDGPACKRCDTTHAHSEGKIELALFSLETLVCKHAAIVSSRCVCKCMSTFWWASDNLRLPSLTTRMSMCAGNR